MRTFHGSEEQHQNLRIGMGDKSILTALALATLPIDSTTSVSDEGATARVTVSGTKDWIECVTRAYAQLPDFSALADKLHANRSETCLAEKLKWLPEHVPPTAGVPVLTMSAYPVGSVAEVLRRTSKSGSSAAAFEYKYDGARVQLHFTSEEGNDWEHARQVGDGARIFSRNMEDTTEKYGSLLSVLSRQVKGSGPVSFIMEGEVVALDRATSTFHPFQVLQAKATTEFCLFAFDLLAINGESLLDVRQSSLGLEEVVLY
jgi:ATP-dependent DNA ligase